MLVELEEVKTYLRVDSVIDDALIEGLISASECLCQDIIRCDDFESLSEKEMKLIKMAVLYATAYFYEHREEANHHDLLMTVRNLLSGIRKCSF